MWRIAGLAVVVLGIAGCSGDGDGLEERDLATLVYWDEFGKWTTIPPDAVEVLDQVLASEDPRFLPYLLDLLGVPTPYENRVGTILNRRFGTSTRDSLADWISDRGTKTPAEDPEEYLEFKQRLFRTLGDAFADFVDPELPRRISAQEVVWGGVRVDGIPRLDDPEIETGAEARGWLNETDLVLGVTVNGEARAYPFRIMGWHELVNDRLGGVEVSIPYCTLCGTAIVYAGEIDGEAARFGTSGLLYRSNKLMYDLGTRTLWEQFSGEPVWGELAGQDLRLEVLPSTVTTWGEWQAAHPGSTVLSIETGNRRDYSEGAAYASYFGSDVLWFAAPVQSGPLALKEIVFVVRSEAETTAYPISVLDERGFVEDRAGARDIIVVATPGGNGGRAYASEGVRFRRTSADRLTLTDSDGGEWVVTEEGLAGPGGRLLERLPGHNAFFFALTNHAAEARLYEG